MSGGCCRQAWTRAHDDEVEGVTTAERNAQSRPVARKVYRHRVLLKYTATETTIASMDPLPPSIWIAAVAHHLQLQLQLHWRTVDPQQLEDAARELMHNPELSQLAPAEAVECWLSPMADTVIAGHHRA